MLEKKWNLFSLLSTTAATLKIKCEFRCTGEEGDDEGAQASSFWQSAVRMTNDQHQRKVTNPLGWVESSLSNAALMVVPMDTRAWSGTRLPDYPTRSKEKNQYPKMPESDFIKRVIPDPARYPNKMPAGTRRVIHTLKK